MSESPVASGKYGEPRCNVCGSSDWRDYGKRKSAACGKCGSLERTRLLFLHLQRLGLPRPGNRILHVAPERGLALKIAEIAGAGYQPVDIDPKRYEKVSAEKFDLCADAPNLADHEYDLIIHNHVLEHIRCDVTAVMLHLTRALKPDGVHLFSVPMFANRPWEEYFGDMTDEEATKRFGQWDHCRNFSQPHLERTLGMAFKTDFKSFQPDRQFSFSDLEAINFPRDASSRIDGHTIFAIRRRESVFGL